MLDGPGGTREARARERREFHPGRDSEKIDRSGRARCQVRTQERQLEYWTH